MRAIITYGSCYGHARAYAEELSRLTGIDAVDVDRCPANLSSMDLIVHIGGLYAGGIRGLSKVIRRLPKCHRPLFIIATVGLADPENPQNRKNIIASAKIQLGGSIPENTEIHHLRGGIDYSSLSKGHRLLMSLLYRTICNKPKEKLSAEDITVIDTYGKEACFMDFSSLGTIAGRILSLESK